MTSCPHTERNDGVCVACGDCAHDVLLNGACLACGATELAPRSNKPLIGVDQLVRKPARSSNS